MCDFSLPLTVHVYVRFTSRAAVGWFRWRSRTTWPKTRIIPARLERAFTLAKNQWNFGGVSKNHAAEVGFSIRVFWSVYGKLPSNFQRKTRMREKFRFFYASVNGTIGYNFIEYKLLVVTTFQGRNAKINITFVNRAICQTQFIQSQICIFVQL